MKRGVNKTRRIAMLVATSLAWQTASIARADSGRDVLDDYLERVTSLTAEFRQTVRNSRGEVVDEATGTVWLERPGRFRWEYREPYPRTIVADGEEVWLYDADLEQVTVRSLDGGLGETPAGLLTGAVDLDQNFRIRSGESNNLTEWVVLEPVTPESDFSRIHLGFAGGELAAMEFEDRLSQQTRIDLLDVEVNGDLTAETFEFVVPEGVDVIRDTDF